MKSDDTRMRTQHGRGAKLLVRTELYDTERVVHMDRTAPPAGEPHSVLGCSVGASQGDVLVIHTSLVNRPYLDQIGTPLSEHVQVVGALRLERRSVAARRRDHDHGRGRSRSPRS